MKEQTYTDFNEAVNAKVAAQRAGWLCGPVKGERGRYYFRKMGRVPRAA